jgi:hypothetical protein
MRKEVIQRLFAARHPHTPLKPDHSNITAEHKQAVNELVAKHTPADAMDSAEAALLAAHKELSAEITKIDKQHEKLSQQRGRRQLQTAWSATKNAETR